MACEDCRGKLSELGELAIELQQWTLRKNEIKNAREALRNELSRGLWDRSEKTTQERNERITRLRTLHEQFLRFDTSRFISDPVVASAQSEERNSRLDENVEVSRGLGDSHEPVEWPPLMNVSEVKTETRAIADETQALLDAVDGLSGMLEVIFKEGVPGDRDQFQSALSAVLVHDDLASARQQWEAYVSARDIIQTNWTALAETYLGILKEESAAEIPPAWVCSPDVPPVFQSSMEDIFAKPLYAYLRSLDIAGGFSPQSPAKRFHFVQSMLDEWPRLERIPEQANTIRAAARQYLERQHEIWKKTAHAVEVLADGIRLARRDWAGQENQALTIQMVSVIRDIEKRLPESSQQLFAIPVRGYENERLRLRAQEMLEAEWEALRVVVEGKLYDGVRAQIGQPADKEGLQKLGVLAGRYTAIEKDLIENGLLRRNRIAGFARIDRRIKQELERL